jgi:hypothetical protein
MNRTIQINFEFYERNFTNESNEIELRGLRGLGES